MYSILISLTSFIAGIIGTLLFKALQPIASDIAQRRLVEIIARAPLKILMRGRLGGEWNHCWYAAGSRNWKTENRCRVTMYALGPYAAGIWEDAGSRWFVSMEIGGDNLITGVWREMKTQGYRGTLMGRYSITGHDIGAMYLGNSERTPSFGVGEWIWWRKGRSQPDLPVPHVQLATRGTELSSADDAAFSDNASH